MKIVNLRMHQLRALKELDLESGILNTEALMLILKKKYAKTESGERMLLKYLDAQDDEKVMARKLYTINMLNGSSYKEINELIIPDIGVAVDGHLAGFAMPLIENHKNLGGLLNDDSINLEEKLNYLIKLGSIINKVQHVKEESFRMQFADLNEFNFIINKDKSLRAVDLDSAYVGQDEPSNMAYYLLKNPYLANLKDKYKTTNNGIIIPSDDSDLYCYNMIILNTLAKDNIFKRDINTYYLYLNYLKELGLDKGLIKTFDSIYIEKPNENPRILLKSINPDLEKELDYKAFEKRYERHLKN